MSGACAGQGEHGEIASIQPTVHESQIVDGTLRPMKRRRMLNHVPKREGGGRISRNTQAEATHANKLSYIYVRATVARATRDTFLGNRLDSGQTNVNHSVPPTHPMKT